MPEQTREASLGIFIHRRDLFVPRRLFFEQAVLVKVAHSLADVEAVLVALPEPLQRPSPPAARGGQTGLQAILEL